MRVKVPMVEPVLYMLGIVEAWPHAYVVSLSPTPSPLVGSKFSLDLLL